MVWSRRWQIHTITGVDVFSSLNYTSMSIPIIMGKLCQHISKDLLQYRRYIEYTGSKVTLLYICTSACGTCWILAVVSAEGELAVWRSNWAYVSWRKGVILKTSLYDITVWCHHVHYRHWQSQSMSTVLCVSATVLSQPIQYVNATTLYDWQSTTSTYIVYRWGRASTMPRITTRCPSMSQIRYINWLYYASSVIA